MANCNRIFFLPPTHWLYYFRKTKKHIKPNLLVTAKPLLSHWFFSAPQASGWTAFSPDVSSYNILNLHTHTAPLLVVPSNWVSTAFFAAFWWRSQGWGTQSKRLLCSVSWTNKDLICSWSTESSLGCINTSCKYVNVSHRSVGLKVHCGPSQTSVSKL